MRWQVLLVMAILVLPLIHSVSAVDFDQPTASEKAQFDEILTPVMMIYNLVKYGATAIAAVMLLFSGITYMTSGGDPKKKETAKNMATYVIIGLLIIWVAPFVVNLLVS